MERIRPICAERNGLTLSIDGHPATPRAAAAFGKCPDDALRNILDQSMRADLAARTKHASPEQIQKMQEIVYVLMGKRPQLPIWIEYALDTGDTARFGLYLQGSNDPVAQAIGDSLLRMPPPSNSRSRKGKTEWRHWFLAFLVDLAMSAGAGKEQAVQGVAHRFKGCRTVYNAHKKYGTLRGPITAKKT